MKSLHKRTIEASNEVVSSNLVVKFYIKIQNMRQPFATKFIYRIGKGDLNLYTRQNWHKLVGNKGGF